MNEAILVVANAFLAGVVCFVCLCRLSVSSKTVLARVRLGYSVLGACFVAVGLCTFYGERPGWSNIAASVGTLSLLFSGSHRWKRGAPPDVQSNRMPLWPQPQTVTDHVLWFFRKRG